MRRPSIIAVIGLCASLALVAPGVAPAEAADPAPQTSVGVHKELDVLFVGAHPDDEATTVGTLGQWKQRYGTTSGIVTITRGEGGGNAVGPEEGPALGLLREREERDAMAMAGVHDLFYLDKVDFYYTVSEPLTRQVWGHESTLEKAVRIVRQTRPKVMLTMYPAPLPGQHGNHQEAARIAAEAYQLAGDAKAFPEQITTEGLQPWSPHKLLLGGLRGTSSPGAQCAASAKPGDPSHNVFGVWYGNTAANGQTWAHITREAQRKFVSQGWAAFPPAEADPAKITCRYYTQVDSRVPFPQAGTEEAARVDAVLSGATVQHPGGLPLGTLTQLTSNSDVLPGGQWSGTLTITAPPSMDLTGLTVDVVAPDGWTVTPGDLPATVAAGKTMTVPLRASVPKAANVGTRVKIGARLTSGQGKGYTDASVAVTPAASAQQQFLPQVAQYEQWVDDVGLPQLSGQVSPVTTIGKTQSRATGIVVTNHSTKPQSGTVSVAAPEGFTIAPQTSTYGPVAPGQSTTVPVTITNTDPNLPDGKYGEGYDFEVTTTSSTGSATAKQGIELVPSATIPKAAKAPTVDGKIADGEYEGQTLDISRQWEGEECSSTGDCSGTAKVTWDDDGLYLAVTVADDKRGSALATTDCKRHWRTDAIEVAVDPTGQSENTSTTFKAAVLPFTSDDGACALRDADQHQGPAAQAAPGMTWAVSTSAAGYVVEVKIPFADLPAAVNPDGFGLNIMAYDSDTTDQTGQTRIGWSVFGGVQGDPYRWGRAKLTGGNAPTTINEHKPAIPSEALTSVSSPESIEQAVRTNIDLAGEPELPRDRAGWVQRAWAGPESVTAELDAKRPGTAHVFVRDDKGTAGQLVTTVNAAGTPRVQVTLARALASNPRVVVAWQGTDLVAGTLSSLVELGAPPTASPSPSAQPTSSPVVPKQPPQTGA